MIRLASRLHSVMGNVTYPSYSLKWGVWLVAGPEVGLVPPVLTITLVRLCRLSSTLSVLLLTTTSVISKQQHKLSLHLA